MTTHAHGTRPTRAELCLPKRTCSALDREGLRTVEQIIQRSARSLLPVHGLGPKSILELQIALANYGLALAVETDDEQD
jgi:DNA-directed RNA polymerase alpha subunit